MAAPAQKASGGPEALHQLAAMLRRHGVDACMYYYGRNTSPVDSDSPVHAEFVKYGNPVSSEVTDAQDCLLIVPETNTGLLDRYPHVTRAIWWLSIDFFYRLSPHYYSRLAWLGPRVLNVIWRLRGIPRPRGFYFGASEYERCLHLAQSEYALRHLRDRGIPPERLYRLSDYLDDDCLRDVGREHRRDVVAYNPSKGLAFTRKIIAAMPRVTFVPVQGLTRHEVTRLFASVKVYIDFGEHPGKDRMPREACIQGACVITGRRGAAAFDEDVPLPPGFRFTDDDASIPDIVTAIRYCLDAYAEAALRFDGYRTTILQERERFESEVAALVSSTMNSAEETS